MKIVLDTNVLIAAFLTSGNCHEVLEAVITQKSCVLSPYILNEFRHVLTSKKFQFSPALIDQFVIYLEKYCFIQNEHSDIKIDFPDASDRKILALYRTVLADFLVTGDPELLVFKKIGGTRIIKPSDFWKKLEGF